MWQRCCEVLITEAPWDAVLRRPAALAAEPRPRHPRAKAWALHTTKGPRPNHAPAAPSCPKGTFCTPKNIYYQRQAMLLKPVQSAQLSEAMHSSSHFLKQKNTLATYPRKLENSLRSNFESNLSLHTTEEGKLLLSLKERLQNSTLGEMKDKAYNLLRDISMSRLYISVRKEICV